MAKIEYKGKIYPELSKDAQTLLSAAEIYTYRYYPKDEIHFYSESLMKRFGGPQFLEGGYHAAKEGFVYKSDWDKYIKLYEQVVLGGKSVVSDTIRSKESQSPFLVRLTVMERDKDGNPELIGGIMELADENMKQAEVARALSDDYYSIMAVDFSKDEVVPYRLAEVVAKRYKDVAGQSVSYAHIMQNYVEKEVIEEEREEMRRVTSWENLNRRLKTKKSYRYDYHIMAGDKPMSLRAKFVRVDDEEKLTKMIIGFSDISREQRERWDQIAFEDPITGGCNYNYYAEQLKEEEQPGYVVSLDIHAFKVINSVCGIAAGDEVLKEVSNIITDVIQGNGFYGHVNADHFVFYLNYDNDEAVIKVLDEITLRFEPLSERLDIPGISPYFGVTKWKPGDRSQVTFSEANAAKHRIKDLKNINYGFYRDEDTKAAIEAKAIEDAFDAAIAEKQFEVWYQPKYSPEGKLLSGAEALIRWRKPNGELVSPGKFIPVFEKNGMIRQLDSYVFETVCRQQHDWIENVGRTVPVSVNLSRASLFTENIVDEYKAITEKIDVLPELVPIEITESAAVGNSDIKLLADKFFDAGFPLHIDDFGTGYSSLSTLNLMRFDTLKLDKSLVDYIGEFGGDRLIKHTVALAKDLGLHVTAEGVEKEDQVEFLKNVDCDNIQGFIYSRPMPADFFAEKLSNELVNEKYLYRRGQVYTYPVILETCRRCCDHDAANKIEGNVAIQLNIIGEGEGAFYIRIQNGVVDIQPYEYIDRNALLTLHADVLMDMIKGRISLENAYKSGLIQVDGDWGAALLLTQIIHKAINDEV